MGIETDISYTYVLRCSDGTFYTGWTKDPERRLASHNSGKGSKYTRTRRPVEMVHVERFETRQEAMSREWHIKRLTRAQKEMLIAGELIEKE
ncbi:MAG: GIY-YIG nuclease family protein [Firmicutes bacterium]|nr:GIY-YIG nuclease family protein [Bacillota bacterium]